MATPLKLGELLVQEKVITPHQLEEALKYQVIFGGKLGTNLIELDFVREDDIAKTLSKMLRVPLVNGDELNNIPQDIISLIPRDMAEQYQAIPLQLENRKLTLVMANPADLKAIDEIAFRTGFIVRPAVAPEVRLILALEHHYHIPREIRYVQVSKKIENELNRLEVKTAAAPKTPEQTKQPAAAPAKIAPQPPKKTPAPPKTAPAPPKLVEKPAEAITQPLPSKPAPQVIEFEEPGREASRPIQIQPKPKPQRPTEVKVKEPAATVEEVMELMEADIVEEGTENLDTLQIPTVFRHLADPSDREDIAESVAAFVGKEVDHCAIFQIRGNVAQGWRLVTGKKEDPRFGEFQIPLIHPSILKTVTDTASYYIGPIPTTSQDNIRLVEALGGTAPITALLVPVIVMSRVVTVLYVDDKSGELAGKLPDLQKLAAKMAMSFEILILKNKILMM
ncbi:MAG: general secretion pathway protein [Desulfuromonadales bacterium]|nr:general secretion pathway protein [Desulfuromonadales bacterium]